MAFHRRGASALEFAILLPAFLLLVTSLVEFSWLFFQSATLSEATRTGCRAGAQIVPDANPGPIEVAEQATLAALSRHGVNCIKGADETCWADIRVQDDGGHESLVCHAEIAYRPLIGLVIGPRTFSGSAIRMWM